MNAARRAALALVLALLAGCATPLQQQPPPRPLSADEQRQLERHTRLRRAAVPPRWHTLAPAAQTMPLTRAASEPPFTWTLDGRTLTLDDYFARQPVAALIVARGREVLVERYAHGRGPEHQYLSNSMAKSVLGLALGLARAEGRIASFDPPLQTWLPELQGTAYGETSLRNLMRMGSGVRFSETYEPGDDSSRYRQAWLREGLVRAARAFDEREQPQGSRFHYASIETALAGAALQRALGESLAAYLTPRLWQAIGAAAPADWQTDPLGLELAHCCLFAQPRDWLRLAIVLAHDGRRPDTGQVVIDREFLLAATDARRLDPPFRPQRAHWGYNHFFWVQPGPARRFALLGVYGQAIFVDPAQQLVMVHLAASAAARADQTSLARERLALWQGVLRGAAP
ncbi:MAG: serine hydrolase [Rubrivivax sp.]